MKHRIRSFFAIPPEIRPDFWQAAYQRNRLSVLVICIMIFGMELFNMARVLFWSSAGLGTLNNRIYFGFYCTLFLSAVLCLLLGFLLRGRSLRCRLAVQYGGVLFFLLWHVCLNAYDLFRDPQAEIGLYYTAVLGLSVFILMPAAPALLMHGSAYALLMALSGRILSERAALDARLPDIHWPDGFQLKRLMNAFPHLTFPRYPEQWKALLRHYGRRISLPTRKRGAKKDGPSVAEPVEKDN